MLASSPQDPLLGVITDLVTAPNIDGLLAKFRTGFQHYGIIDFAVYTLRGGEADLALSCGLGDPLQAQGDKLHLVDFPVIEKFLGGSDAFTLLSGAAAGDVGHMVSAASALIRLKTRQETLGFVLVYTESPREIFETTSGESLVQLTTVFADAFSKMQQTETIARDQARTMSKLQELQEGHDILLLSDRRDILSSILKRGLNVLGSTSGMVWLKDQDEWRLAHMEGMPSTEGLAELETIVHQCSQQGRAALVSSLSGELIWNLDVDTIHMASIAVFPLVSRSEAIGCIAAFDATISQDAADIVSGTCLVGAIAVENWFSREQMLGQHRMEEQLALARKAQQRLLPTSSANYKGMSVAYFSQYCDETGGDYVDAFSYFDRNYSTLVIGDVSGHGLGAAMLMVDVRARIRTQLESGMPPSPDVLLNRVNRVLVHESAEEEFVTLVLCNLDTKTGKLAYANAGHEPPLLFRPREKRWVELDSTGLPLGLIEDEEITFEAIDLEAGDILVLVTDGATEAESEDNVPFGTDIIKETVEELWRESVDDILGALVNKTLKHCENRAFIDDVTYLVAKVDHVNLRMDKEAPEIFGAELYSVEFPSTRTDKDDHLGAIIELLLDKYPEEDMNGVFMAAEEALTNAVTHGNKEDKGKPVRLQLYGDSESVSMVVEDQGVGFTPIESVPNFNNEETLAMESGRGLMMMASLMDEVIYWNQGRNVCLRKFVGREEAE